MLLSINNISKQPQPPKNGKAYRRQKYAADTVTTHRAVEKHSAIVTTISPTSLIRTILPDEFRCTLKYCSSKNSYTTGASGVVGGVNSYQMNGLYDPDATGIGHQPYGFDQVTPFYSVYSVLNWRAVTTVTGVDDTSTYLAWLIRPNNSATVLAGDTLEQVSEYDETNFAMLGMGSSGVPFQQFNLPLVNLPKLEGLSKDAYLGNTGYRAGVTANPGAGPYFAVGIGNANGLSAKVATITVEIFFDAVFQGRKSTPQS